MQDALAKPCVLDGRWRYPKGYLVWRTSLWQEICWRPQLCFKDACKRDMKALLIKTENWEDIATESNRWHSVLQKQLRFGEEQIQTLTEEKRSRHKGRSPDDTVTIRHTCICCGRVYLSCIGLVSHCQCCSKGVNMTSRPGASYMFGNDWRRYACVSYECSPYVLHRPCWHWYASMPFTTPLSWSHGRVNWIHTSECCWK